MGNLKIGWGRAEFSIDGPVVIPGQMYRRISEGILDPLYATALCVDGGEGQDLVIFCTLDMTVLRSIVEPIKEEIRKKCPELPCEKVIFGATHTHSSICVQDTADRTPDGREIYTGQKARPYVAERAAQAVVDAWLSRKKGGIAYGYGYAVVAQSRRTCYYSDTSVRGENPFSPNGTAVMYGSTNDPEFSHYEAGADHFLNAMFTTDETGKLTGMVVNVPCPSQLSECFVQQSADYWADVREAVAEKFGSDIYVLPQCAAAGDLSPRILHYRGAEARRMHLKYGIDYNIDGRVYAPDIVNEKKIKGRPNQITIRRALATRKDIAERILAAVCDIYSWAMKDLRFDGAVMHTCETMHLTRRQITDEDVKWCESTIEQAEELKAGVTGTPDEINYNVTRLNALINRNKRALNEHATLKENPTYATDVHVVRIGDIAFATTQFELYMDYMHQIQARSPFIQTFLIELAGSEDGSYLPTERGVRGRGYSASIFCNRVGFEGGREYVNRTLELLDKMGADQPKAAVTMSESLTQFQFRKEEKK